MPVTERRERTRRRAYGIADSFLSFWLGQLNRHRSAIGRGLGSQVAPVLARQLDDHYGRSLGSGVPRASGAAAARGELGEEIVDIGRWRDSPAVEIDAVALAGRRRTPVLVGEAKWARRVDARRVARERVDNDEGMVAVTAEEVFGAEPEG